MRLQSRTLLAGIGLAALLASAVALAACGGGGSGSKSPTAAPSGGSTAAASPTGDAAPAATTQSQASSDEIDACTLISKADVEAAIGTAVLDPKPEQFPNLASCQFGDPGAPVFHLVSVTVVTESSAGDAKSLFDLGKSNANDPQTVDGVGEDAYWDDTLSTLDTVQGEYELTVDVAPDEGLDQLGAAKTVATKVLANLP